MPEPLITRRPWTHDELLVAMNLYCKLPFGRLHHRTPEIIALAQALGRSSGSLAMKLSNFASLDPALQSRGIKGLEGASKADKEVWQAFHENWERYAAQSEMEYQRLIGNTPAAPAETEAEPERRPHSSSEDAKYPASTPHGATEGERTVTVRYAQSFFRRAVLASYGVQCCITGNPIPELLVASHILPWSQFPMERINPRNGLCFSRTHDAAFDQGLITLDGQYRLVLSKRLRDYIPNPAIERDFLSFEGKPIALPEKFPPDPSFLDSHRRNIFLG